MARNSHLIRRGAAYSARMRVPLDLVEVLGKRELTKALGTSEIAEAKRLLYPIIVSWQRHFDALRARRVFQPEDVERAAQAHYDHALAGDENHRVSLPTDHEIELARAAAVRRLEEVTVGQIDSLHALDASAEFGTLKNAQAHQATMRAVKLGALRSHLAQNQTALIAHEVDDYVANNQLLVDRQSPEWLKLARGLMRAEIEALQRSLERDTGNYTGQPNDPLLLAPRLPVQVVATAPQAAAVEGETISEALAAFKEENPNRVSAGRVEETCRDIGIFIGMDGIGPNFPVRNITKVQVRNWKALLLKYPLRATEVIGFKDLNINDAVALNEKHKRPTLSDRSVNRYLSSLSAFMAWAVDNGYASTNPCSRMSLKKEDNAQTLPFTSDQMNTLFRSPLFAGAQGANAWRFISKPGKVLIRDARYWLPLILLFSGARPGEIAQLAVSDVRQEQGHWVIHITDEGAVTDQGKQVKTKGSKRLVPIHPELIKLGFLKYHERRRKANDGAQLFPDALRNERGQMMSDYSREFGKYLTRLGLKKGRGLSLYSFRHGAVDAFRRAGYLDEQFKFLIGHGKGTMTGRYGTLPQGMLDQRAELIKAIAYPGLDLKHLYV